MNLFEIFLRVIYGIKLVIYDLLGTVQFTNNFLSIILKSADNIKLTCFWICFSNLYKAISSLISSWFHALYNNCIYICRFWLHTLLSRKILKRLLINKLELVFMFMLSVFVRFMDRSTYLQTHVVTVRVDYVRCLLPGVSRGPRPPAPNVAAKVESSVAIYERTR
jgi:hypothetical protein